MYASVCRVCKVCPYIDIHAQMHIKNLMHLCRVMSDAVQSLQRLRPPNDSSRSVPKPKLPMRP